MILRMILLLGVGALLLSWADRLLWGAIQGESAVAAPLSVVVLLVGLAFAGAGVAIGIRALRDL